MGKRAGTGRGNAALIGLGVQAGSEFAAAVLLGLGADYLLGTKNRWVVVGAVVGVLVAMWSMIRVAMRLQHTDPMRKKRAAPSVPRKDGER